jgi:hypothetical protein
MLASIFVSVLIASDAHAERRVALVIGNGKYQTIDVLRNPSNDALAMAAKLRAVGFEVTSGIDLNRNQMVDLVAKFETSAATADVALIFYAGHAVQIDGENYLLPTDIDANQQYTVRLNSIKLSEVYQSVGNKVSTSLMFIDACRNNPFLSRGLRGTGTLSRGLAPVQPINTRNGSFVGFATESGSVASDGDGLNSPYSAAILKHIETPAIDVYDMMSRVGDDVRAATNDEQRPSISSSLSQKGFVFLPGTMSQPQADTSPPLKGGQCPENVDKALWEAADFSNTIQKFEQYMEICPQGLRADEAFRRMEALANIPEWYLALYEDVDLWGKDIEEAGLETETIEMCAATCAANPQCKAFTFVTEKSHCYTKTGIDIPIRTPGALSGLMIQRAGDSEEPPQAPTIETRFTAFPDQAHAGPINMNWQPRGTGSIDACLRSCDREDSCRYATFGVRQSNGSKCAQRFVGLFGEIFGKSDKRGAIAFDKVTEFVDPAGELIPLAIGDIAGR